MPQLTHSRWLIIPLLLLYFLAAVWMAFRLPAHATPNELLNFEYIQVMRQIGGLPNRGLVDSEVRYTEWHQPPVYFGWAALVGLPLSVPPTDTNPPPPIVVEENPHYLSTPRGNLNPVIHITPQSDPLLTISRVAAALLGTLGVAALYRAGRTLVSPWVGLLMASIMAFQPGYLHLSGSVNNDMPLAATTALTMSYALLLLHRLRTRPSDPPRAIAFAGLGFLGVLTILTKANGVFVLAFLGLVLLAALLIYRRWDLTLKYSLALLAGLVPLWAGWLALNTVRMRDTLGLSGSLPVGRVLALGPLDFAHVIPFLPQIWRSYWLDWSAGDVGYGPDWLYAFWLMAVALALLGWLVDAVRGRATTGQAVATSARLRAFLTSPTLLVAAGFIGISYLYFAVKALTVKEAGFLVPEGRWWLPGLAPLAWLVAVGFSRWWRVPRTQAVACLAASAVPPIIAFGLLAFHLPWLYPQAQPLSRLPDGVAATGLVYGDRLALRAVGTEPAVAGEPTELTLYWEATRPLVADLDISTQMLAADPAGWQKLAEHNSLPGGGLSPTRGWAPGTIWRDTLVIVPDGALNGPTLAAVQVGVSEAGQPLMGWRDGATVDPPVVASLVVRPPEPLAPPPSTEAPLAFGDHIRLVAGTVDADPLSVTLWWQALGPTATDYTIFVHLVDAAGALVATADAMPNSGLSPTTIWQSGDIIRDVHIFPAGTILPPGGQILVGAYDPVTGERLTATQAGQPLPNNAVTLDPVP